MEATELSRILSWSPSLGQESKRNSIVTFRRHGSVQSSRYFVRQDRRFAWLELAMRLVIAARVKGRLLFIPDHFRRLRSPRSKGETAVSSRLPYPSDTGTNLVHVIHLEQANPDA